MSVLNDHKKLLNIKLYIFPVICVVQGAHMIQLYNAEAGEGLPGLYTSVANLISRNHVAIRLCCDVVGPPEEVTGGDGSQRRSGCQLPPHSRPPASTASILTALGRGTDYEKVHL